MSVSSLVFKQLVIDDDRPSSDRPLHIIHMLQPQAIHSLLSNIVIG
jgi:hypothetical protein